MPKIDSTVTKLLTNIDSTGVDMYRMKAIGGWLVWLHDASSGVSTQPTFIPNPNHDWNPSTTDDS